MLPKEPIRANFFVFNGFFCEIENEFTNVI
jgi:hypothetical protein